MWNCTPENFDWNSRRMKLQVLVNIQQKSIFSVSTWSEVYICIYYWIKLCKNRYLWNTVPVVVLWWRMACGGGGYPTNNSRASIGARRLDVESYQVPSRRARRMEREEGVDITGNERRRQSGWPQGEGVKEGERRRQSIWPRASVYLPFCLRSVLTRDPPFSASRQHHGTCAS